MKTFSYYATYHYEDSGEVEAASFEEAEEMIRDQLSYATTSGGYTAPWDWVDIHELNETDDDGEDEDE